MQVTTGLRLAIFSMLLIGGPSHAMAWGIVLPPPELTLGPAPEVSGGAVTISEPTLRVECNRPARQSDEQESDCLVEITYVLTATKAGTHLMAPADDPRDRIFVDGEQLEGSTLLSPTPVQVEVRGNRSLSVEDEMSAFHLFFPMSLRHLLVSRDHFVTPRGAAVRLTWVDSNAPVTVRGPINLALYGNDDRVRLRFGSAELEESETAQAPGSAADGHIFFDPHPVEPSFWTRGGPFIGGGVWTEAINDTQPQPRFHFGYEVAVADLVDNLFPVFLAVALEVDNESIMESAVVEIGSSIFFPLFHLFLGAGIVARQLGPTTADVALRGRLGGGGPALSLVVDADLWLAQGRWTTALAVRIGL